MDLRDLIGLAEIKEQQALALLTIYVGKIENKEIQEMIDNYCSNMADSFLLRHSEDFKDLKLNQEFRNYLLVKGADKPHSGYRFYEALYKKMSSPNKNENVIEEPNL